MAQRFIRSFIVLVLFSFLLDLTWLDAQEVSLSHSPRILDATVRNITETSAVIYWRTDTPSDSEVEYGFENNARQERIFHGATVTDHRVHLRGLVPKVTYHFRVKSRDLKGRLTISSRQFFRTATKLAEDQALISNVAVDHITLRSATFSWKTDQPANSVVTLETYTGNVKKRISEEELVLNHRLTYSELSENTLYHYQIESTNGAGITSRSAKGSFRTKSSSAGSNSAPVAKLQVVGKPLWGNRIKVDAAEIVQFKGSNSYDVNGDSLYFRWTFGDGAVSHQPDPVHQYDRAGLYEVNLTVDDDKWPNYPANPFVIGIRQPRLTERGGLIVADFDDDGLLDYALSTKDDPVVNEATRATIGVYGHDGTVLWVRDVDLRINKGFYGLPGIFGPGLAAGDVDGDSQTELLHLNTRNDLVIRNGLHGEVEQTIALPIVTRGAGFWGQFQLVNLRGRGDRDVILQAEVVPNPDSFRNKYPWLTAFSLETGEVLWSTDAYDGVRHGGFRAADIDGDGLDEVADTGVHRISHQACRRRGPQLLCHLRR